MNIDIDTAERDIFLNALDLYQESLKEASDNNAEMNYGIAVFEVKRQEIVDLAAKVRQG